MYKLLVPGVISHEKPEASIKQSDKKLVLKLTRESGANGRVIVPWKLCACNDDSPYKVILIIKLL